MVAKTIRMEANTVSYTPSQLVLLIKPKWLPKQEGAMDIVRRTFMLVALAILITIPMMSTASADYNSGDVLPTCGDAYLSSWNWPAMLQQIYNSSGGHPGGTMPDFSASNSSYIIINDTDMPAIGSSTPSSLQDENYFEVYAGTNMTFGMDSSQVPHLNWDGAIGSADAVDAVLYSDNGQKTDTGHVNFRNGTHAITGGTAASPPVNFGTGYVRCVQVAHNVTYDGTWIGNHFNSVQNFTQQAGTCSALDVGCWIGHAFDNLTGAMQAIGMAAVNVFVQLWAPDSGQITSSFNSMTTSLNAHLGFLTYPFTFIGGFFSAFTSSSSWCTDTSCTKDFGNFFGHDFTVNLNQMATTMPTLWTWFTAFTRGTTVLILILAVRRKYMSVVGH